jgi:glycosyltransferase involved in cell wall biosynthesis
MKDISSINSNTNENHWIEISDTSQLVVQPLVTVYMSTYNHVQYIAEAIEGVLFQKCDFTIELIIAEDCSNDGTREIVLQYQKKYPALIRIITGDKNVGAVLNGIRARKRARGEYIAFCEGDDYWLTPDKLSLQIDILQKQPNVSAVFSDFVITEFKNGQWTVNLDRNIHAELEPHQLRGNIFSSLYEGNGQLRTLTAVYRRSVFDNLNKKNIPYQRYPFGDNFFLAQAASDGLIERIEQITAVYRVSPYSATRSADPIKRLEFIQSVREYYDNFTDYFPGETQYPQFNFLETDVNICRAAFTAGATETFLSTYNRIKNQGYTPALSLKIANILIKSDYVRRFILTIRSLSLALYKKFA